MRTDGAHVPHAPPKSFRLMTPTGSPQLATFCGRQPKRSLSRRQSETEFCQTKMIGPGHPKTNCRNPQTAGRPDHPRTVESYDTSTMYFTEVETELKQQTEKQRSRRRVRSKTEPK